MWPIFRKTKAFHHLPPTPIPTAAVTSASVGRITTTNWIWLLCAKIAFSQLICVMCVWIFAHFIFISVHSFVYLSFLCVLSRTWYDSIGSRFHFVHRKVGKKHAYTSIRRKESHRWIGRNLSYHLIQEQLFFPPLFFGWLFIVYDQVKCVFEHDKIFKWIDMYRNGNKI